MSPLIKYLLTTKYKRHNNQVSGFTMVELLVATIMSVLIITPILAFAVNILEGDVKEEAKASTELELQSAIDYIQQDVSQAYYIYDGAGINALSPTPISTSTSQLPVITNGQPVLVFWKRELVKNAIDATDQTFCKNPSGDDTSSQPVCDDGYVESLVAYYLVKDNNNPSKWCQPGTGNCPARIERWSIKDGVKNANGVYICGTGAVPSGRDAICADEKAVFQRSLGMPYTKTDGTDDGTKFSMGNPTGWKRSSEALDTTTQVLVNYISPTSLTINPTTFCVGSLNIPASPAPTEANYRIGVDPNDATKFTGFSGCVDTSKNIALINIRGDALRRNEARNATCSSDPTQGNPYCPKVTGQIGGRSGFGQ